MKHTKNLVGSNQFVTKSESWIVRVWNRFENWFTRTFIKATKIAFVFTALSWAVFGSFQYGKMNAPIVVKAQEVVREIAVHDFPPILEKICKAESGWKQFNKNGDVIRNPKTPSDVGICQIHETIWNDKARKLGYDIYTEEGNKAMAVWIFEHYGTAPWNSSRDITNGWGK